MKSIFKFSYFINFTLIFFIIYLIYHTIHGQYNIQNYLIHKFEKKLFEDFHYNLKQKSTSVNLDILAIHNNNADMIDEIEKRNNPAPRGGEIVIKID